MTGFDGLLHGFATAFAPGNVIACFLGALVGTGSLGVALERLDRPPLHPQQQRVKGSHSRQHFSHARIQCGRDPDAGSWG